MGQGMVSLLPDKIQGYSPLDILNTMFRVAKNSELPEFVKLEYMKVNPSEKVSLNVQEIGFAHKRALEGCDSSLQMSGLLATMCSLGNQ